VIKLRNVLTASALALVLAAVPTHLAAQEREETPATRAAAHDWLATLWTELAALFATATSPTSPGPGGPSTQGGCSIDPWGTCPGG
jgi:hypothetical protein